ncbi:MAG: cyanophycinase [Segetibacter sp.]|nr:cyanophycinase [Segetibacter sp.]
MTKPNGFLVAVGGAENKGIADVNDTTGEKHLNAFQIGVLSSITRLVKECPVVEVITSASSIPNETWALYNEAFNKLNCKYVGHLNIRRKEQADTPEYLQRIRECNCVMFSGGDQLRICSILGGTKLVEILKERFNRENFVIAGTSAGAMVMSNPMISRGRASLAHLKGEVKISSGLGFLQNIIIDTHFDKRGRFNRLAQTIAAHPGITGVGLGEDTGVIISDGEHLKAIGIGTVTIVDGTNIRHNNITDIKVGKPISIENLKVHLMSNGDMYNLTTRHYEGGEFDPEK